MNHGVVAESQRQMHSRFRAEFILCSNSMTVQRCQSRSWISSHVIISLGPSMGTSLTGAKFPQFRETHPSANENFDVMAPVNETKNLIVHGGKRLRTVMSNGPQTSNYEVLSYTTHERSRRAGIFVCDHLELKALDLLRNRVC